MKVMHPKMERLLEAVNADPICRATLNEAVKNLDADEDLEILTPQKTYKNWFYRMLGWSNGMVRRRTVLRRGRGGGWPSKDRYGF